MNIGFILNKLNNGGAQRATAVLANALVNNGYSVIVYLVKDEEITFELNEKVKKKIIGHPLTAKTGCEYFWEEKKKENIDLYISPMHFDMSYLRILNELSKKGIKTVVVEHASYFYPLSLKLENPAIHYKEKIEIYKNLSALWCVNIRDAAIWKTLGINHTRYLPNIFEQSNIECSRISSTNITYVGRLQADKNVEDLIDWIHPILNKYKNWDLLLAGQGNQEKLLRLKVKQLKLEDQVKFLGFVKDIGKLYNETEILIVPSNNETFSYALAEAKSYGIPALIRENKFNALITTTKGHVTFNSEREFRDNIINLIEHEQVRRHLGETAKHSIKDAFTWEKIGISYKQALSAIVSDETIETDKQFSEINYQALFNSVMNECNYSLKSLHISEKIKYIKEVQRSEISKYALEFDNKFPLHTWQRSFAIKALWMISLIGKFIKKQSEEKRKGFFCVDWETMPEIKNTILDKLQGPVFYFQTGKGKIISKKEINRLNKSKYILMSSETRWLKNTLPGQKRIFINHACGAFKKTGNAITKNYANLYGNYDLVIASSPYISKELSQAFLTPESKIIATGLPRTDKCFDKSLLQRIAERIHNSYPFIKEKKIYLFGPTFRTDNGIYLNKFNLNWDEVSSLLNDNEIMIISLHPHIKNQIKTVPITASVDIPTTHKNIIFINDFTTFELTTICDVFITDYSSAIFEAMLLNKDVALFAEDVETYNRGFYFDYYQEGPCSPYTASEAKDFINYIRKQTGNHNTEKYLRFKKKHLASCDGHSTERVISLLNSME